MVFITGLVLAVSLSLEPKEVVSLYLKNLPLCFKTGMNVFVSEIVEEKIARRLQIWLDAWRFSGYSPSAELISLNFKEIREKSERAVVVTEERWKYSYIYTDSGKTALEPQEIFYEIRYILEKKEGKWKIKEIEILKEVKKDGSSTEYRH